MSYIHYGSSEFDINKFGMITNQGTNKPLGGLWASPVDNSHYCWKDWCIDNDYKVEKLKESFIFDIEPDAKILRIWSNYDLYQLDIYDNDLRYYQLKHPGHTWWTLDFERMIHDGYDGMEVIISTNDIYYALYGWDCDSLLVFNPDIMIF